MNYKKDLVVGEHWDNQVKSVMDKGYKPVKELYDNIIYCYPKLDGMSEP